MEKYLSNLNKLNNDTFVRNSSQAHVIQMSQHNFKLRSSIKIEICEILFRVYELSTDKVRLINKFYPLVDTFPQYQEDWQTINIPHYTSI